MTLQELTNILQDLCHQGYAQDEINLDNLSHIKKLIEGVKHT